MTERRRLGARIVSALKDSRTTRRKVTERPAFEQASKSEQTSHVTPRGDVSKRPPARIPSQPRSKKVVRRLTPEDAVRGYNKKK